MISLLLSLLFMASPSQAQPTQANWQCHLEARLNGDPWFFWRYGENSWNGKGRMICLKSGLVFTDFFQINISTWGPGTGVNSQSILEFEIVADELIQIASIVGNFPFEQTAITLTPQGVRHSMIAKQRGSRFAFYLKEKSGVTDFFNSSRFGTLVIKSTTQPYPTELLAFAIEAQNNKD